MPTDRERYDLNMHRVQTAIAAMPDHPIQSTKHMRVGIDMSKSDMGGLVTLLLEKGVFTEEEYYKAMADAAEREADAYEKELSDATGINIKTL